MLCFHVHLFVAHPFSAATNELHHLGIVMQALISAFEASSVLPTDPPHIRQAVIDHLLTATLRLYCDYVERTPRVDIPALIDASQAFSNFLYRQE